MEPRDVAEAIERQKKQKEGALAQLSAAFSNVPGWRRMASGSFGSDIAGNVRAVVAPAPSRGFLCNIRVGSRIVASRTLETPAEALEYVNQVREELNAGG